MLFPFWYSMWHRQESCIFLLLFCISFDLTYRLWNSCYSHKDISQLTTQFKNAGFIVTLPRQNLYADRSLYKFAHVSLSHLNANSSIHNGWLSLKRTFQFIDYLKQYPKCGTFIVYLLHANVLSQRKSKVG